MKRRHGAGSSKKRGHDAAPEINSMGHAAKAEGCSWSTALFEHIISAIHGGLCTFYLNHQPHT